MKIQTTRFGELEVPAACILSFAKGLPGFPRLKRYALFPYSEDGPFFILQAVSEPDLTMLLVDPYRFFGDYVFEVNDKLAKELGFTADNPPHTFTVVTLKDQIEDATVNLSAPVLVNWVGRTGVQLVLDHPTYSIRQKLFPQGMPQSKEVPGKKHKTKPGTDFVPQQEAI